MSAFSKRNALLLLLVAVLLGRRTLRADEQQAIAAIEKAGGMCVRDEDQPDHPVIEVLLQGRQFTDQELAHVANFRNLKHLALAGSQVTDEGLVHLQDLNELESLYLTLTKVKGEGLAHLKGLGKLESLDLHGCQLSDKSLLHAAKLTGLRGLNLNATPITDKGLAHLSTAKSLVGLYLYGTKVTDDGLIHIKDLPELHTLVLSETLITDRGLTHLYGSKNLLHVGALGTGVTDQGAADLKARVPGVSIVHKIGKQRRRRRDSLVRLEPSKQCYAHLLFSRQRACPPSALLGFRYKQDLARVHVQDPKRIAAKQVTRAGRQYERVSKLRGRWTPFPRQVLRVRNIARQLVAISPAAR